MFHSQRDTGSDGRFVLPFAWSQTEIGKLAGQGYGKASIYVGIWTDQGHTYTNQWCNVYLMLDIRYLIAFGYTPLSMSVPDAASIGKDFFAAFKDMLPAHGVFYPSALILSTDVYGLAGRVSVGIAPPA